jgi:ABC-type uncharacterized transport system permease subunit
MNIKVKAALIVAGIMTAGVTASLATKLAVTYIPVEILIKIAITVICGALLSLLYAIVLNQLKIDAKIKNLVDRK